MTKRRSNFSLIPRGGLLFVIVLATLVTGCKKEAPPVPPKATPLPNKAQPAKPTPPVHTQPTSARKTTGQNPVQGQSSSARRLPDTVNLDFTNRRDPFRPYVQALPQQVTAAKFTKGRVRDPLPIQRFDTEKFRVSGIVTGLKENSALVIDPTGKGYVVKEGMLLGNNDGVVLRVTTNTVEVEESFRDDSGRVRKRLVKLTLLRKK